MSWSIERYLNVRQAYGPSFAPEGRALAFLTNITGLPQVWQVGLTSSTIEDATPVLWPDQVTFETNRVSEVAYSPAPHDNRLIYVSDVGGSEQHQLFLLEVDRATVHPLSAGYEGAMHIFGSWSRDGQRICFAANRRHPALFDLYVQDVGEGEVGEARLVWENPERGYLRNLAFAPGDNRIVATRTASSFDHALLEIDLETGLAQTLLETEEPARIIDARYDSDGASLLLITDLDADFLYIARLDLHTGELDKLVAPGWNCESMALSEDGQKLAYTVNVEGADRLFLLDLNTWQTLPAPEFATAPGMVTDGRLLFSPDARFLAFAFTSATRTSDIYVWDLAHNRVRAVTVSSHGGLPPSAFVSPELITYPTFDRDDTGAPREIPAWFFRPEVPTGYRLPVVVIVHGGPEGQSRPGFQFLVQYLVHRGYAVLLPNVRGSTGYGKTYSHLDDVEKRMDSVADLAHAARWLKAQPDVDGDRVVVYGGSYGGFMVLASLTTYPDLWAAGVDIVGISNLATFLENTSDYRRAHREAEYGSLARDRAFLERIAPMNHVDQIVAPLMVIHGRNDPRVPLSEAEQLVAAVEARGVPVRFLVFDDEGHGVIRLENKLVAYPAIINFLKEHVS